MPSRSNSPLAATAAAQRPALALLATAVLALVLAVLSMFPAAALAGRVSEADRPTIVLVHGAWAGPGGWDEVAGTRWLGPGSWDQVRAALAEDGDQTAAPALGLLDMPTDVATVRATLDAIPGEKILVGHSYGRAVISQAAAGHTDIRGLVFTAAFAPDEGQSLPGSRRHHPQD
jgi:pimeloyl-ACP methyl ester carboxylesterase